VGQANHDALISRVRKATRNRERAARAWDAAVLEAHDKGVPLARIAEAVGGTHQMVAYHIKKHRGAGPKKATP
jgi:hypothetical protein